MSLNRRFASSGDRSSGTTSVVVVPPGDLTSIWLWCLTDLDLRGGGGGDDDDCGVVDLILVDLGFC